MIVLKYSLINNNVLQGQELKFYLKVIYTGTHISFTPMHGDIMDFTPEYKL